MCTFRLRHIWLYNDNNNKKLLLYSTFHTSNAAESALKRKKDYEHQVLYIKKQNRHKISDRECKMCLHVETRQSRIHVSELNREP